MTSGPGDGRVRDGDLRAGERRARIRFLTTQEGGRSTPPMAGVRPQLALGDHYASCIVESTTGATVFRLGEEIVVTLRVVLVEQSAAAFAALTSLELFEGDKLVATGTFLDT